MNCVSFSVVIWQHGTSFLLCYLLTSAIHESTYNMTHLDAFLTSPGLIELFDVEQWFVIYIKVYFQRMDVNVQFSQINEKVGEKRPNLRFNKNKPRHQTCPVSSEHIDQHYIDHQEKTILDNKTNQPASIIQTVVSQSIDNEDKDQRRAI